MSGIPRTNTRYNRFPHTSQRHLKSQFLHGNLQRHNQPANVMPVEKLGKTFRFRLRCGGKFCRLTVCCQRTLIGHAIQRTKPDLLCAHKIRRGICLLDGKVCDFAIHQRVHFLPPAGSSSYADQQREISTHQFNLSTGSTGTMRATLVNSRATKAKAFSRRTELRPVSSTALATGSGISSASRS